jgi:ADP-heptose:LPS heptosyltransferase
MIDAIISPFRQGLYCGTRLYYDRILRILSSKSDLLNHRFRFPIPSFAPHNNRLVLVARASAMGDVLMCTPALRRLKQINPMCRVVFFTRYRDIVEGLSFLDEVCDYYDVLPPGTITLIYEHCPPGRRHLSRVLGDWLGLRVPNVRPACIVPVKTVSEFRENWRKFPRPWVVINRNAGPWTPNKDWPASHWDELVERVSTRATVVEIGKENKYRIANVTVDLRGKTTRMEMIAAIAASDLHVGPISGPVHIAAAVGTPAVVIYGGYEHPSGTSYPGNINLYSPVACSPCWLRTPCPYNRECLSRISVDHVECALWKLWNRVGHEGFIRRKLI